MAPSLKLSASARSITGKKSAGLRRHGRLPAVVYGQQPEATALELDLREFQTVWGRAGKTHLVDLALDGARPVKVLIREVQTHPRRQGPVHVDLYRVNLRDKLHADVPVVLVGESPAVKRGDGDILFTLHQVRVECLPADIPESIEVDLSGLDELDQGLRLADLTPPAGVAFLTDGDEMVVKVAAKKAAMEVAAEEEAAAAEAAEAAEAEAGEAAGEAGGEGEAGSGEAEAAESG
jgi:large subunit ribosomal protein L25